MARFVFRERESHCPVDLCLTAIGSKWAALILWQLKSGRVRYSELKRRMPGISHKMLAQRLRELEADGLIERRVYPEVPPRTEYAMSEEGARLMPTLDAMRRWGMAYKVPA